MNAHDARQIPSPDEIVAAANRNHWVQEYRHAKDWSECWTEETISRRPPLRMEFEHAIFFGTISEGLSIRRSKASWGALLGIEPLRVDDFLHPSRVVYVLKPTNRMHQRWQFRRAFKRILGKSRRLVNDAVRQSLKEFMQYLAPSDAQLLQTKLGLTAREFWRRSKFGDRYGVDGALEFVQRLEECTKGYRFRFEGAEVNRNGSDVMQLSPPNTVGASGDSIPS
jgi:hypothetical protein